MLQLNKNMKNKMMTGAMTNNTTNSQYLKLRRLMSLDKTSELADLINNFNINTT